MDTCSHAHHAQGVTCGGECVSGATSTGAAGGAAMSSSMDSCAALALDAGGAMSTIVPMAGHSIPGGRRRPLFHVCIALVFYYREGATLSLAPDNVPLQPTVVGIGLAHMYFPTHCMAVPDTTYLEAHFTRCIKDAAHTTGYNERAGLFLIGSYSEHISNALIELANYVANLCQAPICKPVEQDNAVHCAANNVYVGGDYTSATKPLELQHGMRRPKEVTSTLREYPKAPTHLMRVPQLRASLHECTGMFSTCRDC